MDVLYEMVSSVAGIELAPGGGLRDAFAMREVVVASDDEPLAGQKAREVAIALDMLGHAVGNLDNTAGTGTALVAPDIAVDGRLGVGARKRNGLLRDGIGHDASQMTFVLSDIIIALWIEGPTKRADKAQSHAW